MVNLVSPFDPTAQVILITKDAAASVNPDLSVEVADVDAVYEAVRATGAEAVVLEDGGSRAGLIEMQDPAVGWHRIKDDWATEPGPTMRSMARVDPVVGAFG